jgi:hypothetical protein
MAGIFYCTTLKVNVVKLSSADLLSFGEERGEAKKGGLT